MSIEIAVECWIEDNMETLMEYFADDEDISEYMWEFVDKNKTEHEFGLQERKEREALMFQYIVDSGLEEAFDSFVEIYTYNIEEEIYQEYLENNYWEAGDAEYCASKEGW